MLALPFLPTIGRPERDNTIDLYLSDEPEEVVAEGRWQRYFTSRPDALTKADKQEWLAKQTGVSLGGDAFFSFGDNIERACRSGVHYVAQPGGSIRYDQVIDTCNRLGVTMCMTHTRLFHH